MENLLDAMKALRESDDEELDVCPCCGKEPCECECEQEEVIEESADKNKTKWWEKAWLLNQIISFMNDEEAYYSSGWLYIWPDGETKEQCKEDFGDEDDYLELESAFTEIYSDNEYHDAGLYFPERADVSADEKQAIIDAAHEWDNKLGLSPVDIIK